MRTDTTVEGRMRTLVAEILEIEEAAVHDDSRLREDLGMDSLGSLELLSSISEQLNTHLELEDATGIVTFKNACDFVQSNMASERDAVS